MKLLLIEKTTTKTTTTTSTTATTMNIKSTFECEVVDKSFMDD
jgi:hypothetical protein